MDLLVSMFKKSLVLVLFLLLAMQVFAVTLVDPIRKELSDGDFVGAMSPGATMELIFSKEFDKYDTLTVLTPLPSGFTGKIKSEVDSVKLLITASNEVLPSSNDMSVQLTGPSATSTVKVHFTVVKGLLDSSLVNNHQNVVVGNPAEYAIDLVNKSDATSEFTIKTTIPNYVMGENQNPFGAFVRVVAVPKQSTVREKLILTPVLAGSKNYLVSVSVPEKKNDFSISVDAQPSYRGKLVSPIFGLPFYSFSLSPAYAIDALIAAYFK